MQELNFHYSKTGFPVMLNITIRFHRGLFLLCRSLFPVVVRLMVCT